MTSTAFDQHAAGYDSVAESALGRELRSRVRSVLIDLTAPGDAVVDLGCGTGLDAAWLAPQVGSVHAIDASAAMADKTRTRCAGFDNVTVEQIGAAALELDEPADVVLANFGVINCVGDLASFGNHLHDMLTPGGCAVVVTMPRWCPVELAVAAATRNKQLLERRRAQPADAAEGDYHGLSVRYASTRDLQVAFGDRFRLKRSESLGLVLPPFEQRSWVEDRPTLRRRLAALDRRLGSFGARTGLGDHHIAVFETAR